MLTLIISQPPSLNASYFNRPGGRSKTPEYKAWKEMVMWEIKAQRPTPIPGHVTVSIEVGPPRNPRADIDNRAKPVLDCLQGAGVIEDDCLVDKLTIYWGIETRVTIKPVEILHGA